MRTIASILCPPDDTDAMKVLVISGGAASGNTSVQCQTFLSSLPERWGREMIRVGDLIINHCDGCGSCAGGECRHDDDMAKVIGAFDSADAVVFATPIRFNGPSSAVKAVIDRFQVVWESPDLIEKKRRFMTFIASSGSDKPDIKPCTTIFRSFCFAFGGEWIEPHVFTGTDRSTEGMAVAAAQFASKFAMAVVDRIDP